MHRRVRAVALCLLQSGIWHAVLYSLQEDKYYVEMQCISTMLKCSVLIHMVTTWNLVDRFILRPLIIKTWRKDSLKIKEYCLNVHFSKEVCIVYLVNLKLFNVSFKLSLEKCASSVWSTINLEFVNHEIVNVNIKAWKPHDGYRKE